MCHTPDHTPDHTADHTADHTPDHTADHTADHTPDHTADHAADPPKLAHRTDLDGEKNPLFRYELEEGICNHSYALHTAAQAGVPERVLTRVAELLAIGGSASAGKHGEHGERELLEGRKGDDAAGVARGVAGGVAGGAPMGEAAEGERAEGSKESEMQQVEDALRSLCSGRESFRIPSGYQPPPRLQGKSCVYVLQLRRVGGDLSHELYVGEVNSHLAVPNLSHPIFPNLFVSLLAS